MKTDLELRNEVQDELNRKTDLNSTTIGVAVEDGVVMLTGYVNNWAEKQSAECAAEQVSGVKAVAEEIEIRPSGHSRWTDVDMARAAENALAWNMAVPKERVKVVVERGRITLEGEVDQPYQKEAAENAMYRLPDVKGIRNHIVVKPTISPIQVKAKTIS